MEMWRLTHTLISILRNSQHSYPFLLAEICHRLSYTSRKDCRLWPSVLDEFYSYVRQKQRNLLFLQRLPLLLLVLWSTQCLWGNNLASWRHPFPNVVPLALLPHLYTGKAISTVPLLWWQGVIDQLLWLGPDQGSESLWLSLPHP